MSRTFALLAIVAFAGPVAAQPKAGEERAFEIAQGVKMKFCWIPAGKATLGSPKTELDRFDDESEHEFATKGFWLGKYEVTQEEWKAVMGNNPSIFTLDGNVKNQLQEDKIKDTSRFPVENVSWDDCQKFLEKVNKRDGVEKVFGKRGKFCLPHEYEWEYACRGSKGNKEPFYWGNELNGTQANCRGESPYGTKTKGQTLGRPCAVDDTNGGKYEKHPWGLCHMLGNVWEWCENKDKEFICAIRGGSQSSIASGCRSAFSTWSTPDYRSSSGGFRVCFHLD
jgi:formylglycine-generating enzyme required for sulfatase activity